MDGKISGIDGDGEKLKCWNVFDFDHFYKVPKATKLCLTSQGMPPLISFCALHCRLIASIR